MSLLCWSCLSASIWPVGSLSAFEPRHPASSMWPRSSGSTTAVVPAIGEIETALLPLVNVSSFHGAED